MRWRTQQIRGYYAVLDRPSYQLAIQQLSASRLVQARIKPASPAERREVASLARAATALTNALLVVNDDVDLANEVGADGVHLGQGDESVESARRRSDLFIGVSTHDRAQLEQALSDGADYVAYGPVFATKTKADPDPVVGLDGLARAVELAGDVPVVAIGGITGEHVAAIRETGAAAACVISWVNNASDPRARARAIAAPWGQTRVR